MSTEPSRREGISGRKFVPIGLAVILVTFAGFMLIFINGPKGSFTKDAAGPRGAIKARIEARCADVSVRDSGKCVVGQRLTVSAESSAETAKYVTWALYGKGGVVVRSSPMRTPVEIDLDLEPGPYMIVAVVGDEALDTKSLPSRFGGEDASVDPFRGLDVIEGFANDARQAGRVATVTRLPVRIDALP